MLNRVNWSTKIWGMSWHPRHCRGQQAWIPCVWSSWIVTYDMPLISTLWNFSSNLLMIISFSVQLQFHPWGIIRNQNENENCFWIYTLWNFFIQTLMISVKWKENIFIINNSSVLHNIWLINQPMIDSKLQIFLLKWYPVWLNKKGSDYKGCVTK